MVVFFDIDGTVVDNESQIIPESTVRAVAELKKQGHLAVVNTGRPYGHLDPRLKTMDFGGWICACGMEVMLNGAWLYRDLPSPAVCREVIRLVRQHRMQVVYEEENVAYLDGEHSASERAVHEVGPQLQKGLPVRQLEEDTTFVKFVTFDHPGCQREAFRQAVSPWFTGTDRENTMIEYVKNGCSKALGMERLLTHLGIPKAETLAIGDSTNDLPMFAAAGKRICMGEGMEELKAAADYITQPVLEDGVARALAHFGLIPRIFPL